MTPRTTVRILIAMAALGAALAAPSTLQADSGSGRQPTASAQAPGGASPPAAVSRTPQRDEAKPESPGDLTQRPQHKPKDDPRSDRGRDVSVHHRRRHQVYTGRGIRPYGWYPWGYWGGGLYYAPYPYYPWGFGVYQHARGYEEPGALDLDLRPEKAQVYLDGQRIGLADDFDGWPRYLWLEAGTYDLVFYHPGYETISREFTVYPGVVIDVDDKMVEGEATPPEELAPALAERRARNQQTRGREQLPDWLERAKRGGAQVDDHAAPADGAYDARSAAAIVRLEVEPGDAAIYLDGRFLGTAESLLDGGGGLKVDPGEHELEVARPGYASAVRRFTAESGEEIELEIELEEE